MGSLRAVVPLVPAADAGAGAVVVEGSCITRSLGNAVSEVDDDDSDWSRCLYNNTVPSAKPIARCTRFRESAMHETGNGLRAACCSTSLTERKSSGGAGGLVGLGSGAVRSKILRMGPRVLVSS